MPTNLGNVKSENLTPIMVNTPTIKIHLMYLQCKCSQWQLLNEIYKKANY